MLFTSLFTIAMSINDGIQQNNFRQVGGFSHGGFKYLTEEQFHELKDDPLIDQWGLRRVVGMPLSLIHIFPYSHGVDLNGEGHPAPSHP